MDTKKAVSIFLTFLCEDSQKQLISLISFIRTVQEQSRQIAIEVWEDN